MLSGARLTLAQREEISIGLELGESFAVIAVRVGVHRSTVGREVRGNWPRHSLVYRALPAHAAAMRRAPRPKPRKLAPGTALRGRVVADMAAGWSAQQVAGRLRRQHPQEPQWWVSHETIYKAWYVQGKGSLRQELIAELGGARPRTGPVRRRSRDHRSGDRRGRIADAVPISQRPPQAADRAIPGHWEGDLIVGPGNKSALATVVERASRFTVAATLPQGRGSAHVTGRLAETIKHLPEVLFETLTWDRGMEMAEHARFSIDTGVQVFFADPYSPWQRPTNENTNRLIRHYLPKTRDLSTVTDAELQQILTALNTRPRKVLGYQTPAERLLENLAVATTD